MSRPSLRQHACSRRVLAVFAVLVTGPLLLAINSFRPIVIPPASFLTVIEPVFRLLAYTPVAFVRQVLFDPVGIGGVFDVPVVGHLFLVTSLLAFYYCLSLLLVTVATAVYDALRDATWLSSEFEE